MKHLVGQSDSDCGQVMIRVEDQVDVGIDSKFSRAHCWNGGDTLVFSANVCSLFFLFDFFSSFL